jgi:hypothetical protein
VIRRITPIAWVPFLFLAACADVWGFKDLTLEPGEGGSQDATASDAPADAPRDATVDALGDVVSDAVVEGTMSDHDSSSAVDSGSESAAGEAGNDAAESGVVADAGIDAGADASPGPEAGCGPPNTILNCSACGTKCDTSHSLNASCSTGTTCTYGSCASGWGDCNTTPPNADGCETAFTSTSSCGGCTNVCDTAHSLGATCDGTSCKYASCKTGWADCVTAPPDTDGCETQITGAASCGSCGQTCDTTHSVGATCSGSTCTYTSCAAGWFDCNTTPPNTNGCETSLSSTSSCGACGQACSTQTGTPSCNGTRCSYACNAGRADCNASNPGANTDGCECQTPGCCAAACQTTHSTGIASPATYYDCNATGHGQTEAQAACTAFTGSAGACTASSVCCFAVGLCTSLTQPTTQSVCGSAGGTCYCWQYAGPNPGTVRMVSASNCVAVCSSGTDPAWN